MDDIIRLVLNQIGHITPIVLRYDGAYAFNVFYHLLPLLIRKVGQPLMRCDSFICIKSYHHIAIFSGFIDDVN